LQSAAAQATEQESKSEVTNIGESHPCATELLAFLEGLRRHPVSERASPASTAVALEQNPRVLQAWFERARAPLQDIESANVFGNPWTAAKLGRDETRNSRVLRWFLDPRGGHGLGPILLQFLLRRAREVVSTAFPDKLSRSCQVLLESYPDRDGASRVDIQIDDPSFFLIVEVKIDAAEQPDQIERYCTIAEARNATSWAVVFLTGKIHRGWRA
jgi:hypothetical protein